MQKKNTNKNKKSVNKQKNLTRKTNIRQYFWSYVFINPGIYYKGIIQMSSKKLKTWGNFYSPACLNHSCFSSIQSDVTRRTESLN